MSIPNIDKVTGMDSNNLPILQKILDDIRENAASTRLTSTTPTAKTVQQGEFVVHDDNAGVRRVYVKTGKGNLGSFPLTQAATVTDAATQDLTGTDTVDKTKLEADLTSCKNAINALIDRLQTLGLIA